MSHVSAQLYLRKVSLAETKRSDQILVGYCAEKGKQTLIVFYLDHHFFRGFNVMFLGKVVCYYEYVYYELKYGRTFLLYVLTLDADKFVLTKY